MDKKKDIYTITYSVKHHMHIQAMKIFLQKHMKVKSQQNRTQNVQKRVY